METTNKTLNAKLSQYALISTTALLSISAASDNKNEAIVYKDIEDVILSVTANDEMEYQIDLNEDGYDDAEVIIYNYKEVADGYEYDFNYAYFNSSNPNNKLLSQEVSLSYGRNEMKLPMVIPLNEGMLIGPEQKNWGEKFTPISITGVYYSSNLRGNVFAGKEAYVGLKFRIKQNIHFGWIRLEIASDGKMITIKDYAYNSKALAPIKAGEK